MSFRQKIIVHKINLMLDLADVHRFVGETGIAEKVLGDAFLLADENEDYLSKIYRALGHLFFVKSEYAAAEEYYQKAYNIFGDNTVSIAFGKLMGDMGYLYWRLGKGDMATDFFQKELSISESLDDKQGISNALVGFGILQIDAGRYEQGKEYHQRSMEISRELNDKRGIGRCLNNLGDIYALMGDGDAALENYHKILEISTEIGNKVGIGVALNNLGHHHLCAKEYSLAIKYFDEAMSHREKSMILYRELYNETPNIEYKKIIKELSSKK